MIRAPKPDPVAGWADLVAFVPSDELREDEPKRRRRKPKGWVVDPEFQPYGEYEGLLVRTVLLRSDKYTSMHDLPIVTNGWEVSRLCKHVGYYDQEHIVVLTLDSSKHVTAIYELAIGSTDSAQVQIPHAMKVPLLAGASTVILVHNHPSGNKMPSQQDRDLTERLYNGLLCVGIPLIDHVIVSHGDYYSFRDHRLSPFRD
jgi:DNA repair protein RadC